MTQKRVMVPQWTIPITLSAYTSAGVQLGSMLIMINHDDCAADILPSVLFLTLFSTVAAGLSVYIWKESKK